MESMLIYNDNSISYINELLKKKFFKGLIVVSAQNFTFGGPWKVLNNAMDNIAEYKKDYLIIVIVFKELEKNYGNVINLICKESKKSWIHRLYYEKFKFNKLSKSINKDIDVWISMHDITPIVKAKKLITYYHNPSPFWKPKIYQMFLSPVTTLFMLFYFKICQLNISRNYALIVQQLWIKEKFIKKFRDLNVIVSKPISNKKIDLTEKKIKDFSYYEKLSMKPFLLCPTTPRVFKNIETAINATKILKTHNLLITINGNENIYTKYLKFFFSSIKNVFFIGHVEREVLEILYKKTDAVIFPSQLETWGLPITESIEFNKMIFVPDLEYARETCGNYNRAIFFTSGSSTSLRNKLSKYLLSDIYQNRFCKNNNQTQNLDNINKYTWDDLWRKLF